MNINPDDPKWTAYVLGELNDQERTQVEQQLESSQAAREVVEEIRVTTALLQHELAEEQHLGLTAKQRTEVTAASLPQQSRPMFRWAAVAASLAAAVLVMVALWTPALLRSRQEGDTSLRAVTSAPQPAFDRESAQREVSAPHEDPAKEAAPASLKAVNEQEAARLQQLNVQLGHLTQQGQQGQLPQQNESRDGVFEGAAGAFRTDTFGGVSSFSELKRSAAPLPPAALADRQDQPRRNTEAYDFISDNGFIRVAQEPVATFSIDVDTASYANMRRFLTMNQMPPKDSVRIEEMINYFTYDYPSPTGRHPIAAYTEVAAAPWTPEHRLVRIGVKAREMLVEQMSGTLMTVAKDVSIQIEFNQNEVNAYRLIGYENRALRHQDFNDDQKDAGEIGAGHTVTALFEVVPRGIEVQSAPVDTLKYQQPAQPLRRAPDGEILNLKIRYKAPDGNASQLIETPVLDRSGAFNSASADFRFAAAVASFGMILRESPYKGQSTIDAVIEMAERSKGTDTNGYRDEFVRLARRAREMK